MLSGGILNITTEIVALVPTYLWTLDLLVICFLFPRTASWILLTEMILVRQLMTKERKDFDKKRKKRSKGKRGVVDKWLIDMKKCDCVLGCLNHLAIIRGNLGEHDHTTRFLCVQCNMRYWRALDLRTRTSTSTRFNLELLRVF